MNDPSDPAYDSVLIEMVDRRAALMKLRECLPYESRDNALVISAEWTLLFWTYTNSIVRLNLEINARLRIK